MSTANGIIASFAPVAAAEAIELVWPVVRVVVGCLCDCSCGGV